MGSAGDEAGQRPDGPDGPDDREGDAAGDGGLLEIAFASGGRWLHEGGNAADGHRATDGEHEVGEQVLTEEHVEQSSKAVVRNPIGRRPIALVLAVVLAVAACSGDDGDAGPATTTTVEVGPTTSTTVPNDPALLPLLVTVDDLPAGFAPTDNVGDTITAFCANEDAAAGLQASGRAIVGFSRAPAGVSVLQVVFRFRAGDAATFVRQAGEILQRCDNVPDATGLAFDYEDAAPELVTALTTGTDDATASTGVSAGSGSLRSVVGVVHRGDVASLVAVLAVDTDAATLEELARTVFTAAAARLVAN